MLSLTFPLSFRLSVFPLRSPPPPYPLPLTLFPSFLLPCWDFLLLLHNCSRVASVTVRKRLGGGFLGVEGAGCRMLQLREVIPDVPMVPTISLKCKRQWSPGHKALTAGALGMPGGGGGGPTSSLEGSQSGLRVYLCLQHPFLLFQRGDPSSPKFIRGGFPTPLIKYCRRPHDSWLHL